ncbi:LamG-like jellyroll fold domain-containing protein [Flavobacterium terrigena]|uniref:PhoD-like phosphatase n=1 Tax=Flavobacterium terrigena TaxID=402734 RepID=A0A1H6VW96_9FLAO|nr:LamG-like jellyroll fold domain-containing protein [Flavobacterium terrigena]SEJ04900.1 PhoD-like phosphatase [Flavobacterium terrigena]
MRKKLFILGLLFFLGLSNCLQAQTIPGDSIVFGPMMSVPYNNKVRVWVLTKNNTGSGNTLSISMSENNTPGSLLTGTLFNTDTRLGYNLRSYEYTNLAAGGNYTAKIMINGVADANRTTIIKNEQEIIDDFEFLSGGCARIYDLSRCIDLPESTTHFNGTPQVFNVMAQEGSDMMVWLGDATYLLGNMHAPGQCPGALDDWANKDMAFDRYMFYRGFHDNLIKAMPQIAITDNHDTGPNDFDKTMPTLAQMKEIFKDWWPNPEYLSTPENPGLHSSYKYKDVEYFMLDNRSYRVGNAVQLGPDQLIWLKSALLASTAKFKVIISGTPTFTNLGGRNFSATAEATDLTNFIKNNNINGVLCLSADIHSQRLYTRQGSDVKYPLYDFVSGNVNSDVSSNAPTIDYNANPILSGGNQTYLRINVFGPEDDRRMKVEYVRETGVPYFESIIHEDMLTSQNADALKLELKISNSLTDSSTYNHSATATNVTYVSDRNGVTNEALSFGSTTSVTIPNAISLNFHNRPFSLVCWVKPTQFQANGSTILSNGATGTGVSLGIDANGKLTYKDHASNVVYTSQSGLAVNEWAYVTWKYDNVRRKLYLYLNGLATQTWNNVISPVISPADLKVGDNFEGKKFIGALDNLVFYGRLISDETILAGAEFVSTRGASLRVTGASQMVLPGALVNNVLSDDFTIEFWARLNSDPGTNFKLLASNGRVGGNTTGISFEFPDSNKLNVVLGNNTSGWSTISEQGAAWNIGEWNHVTVTAVKNGLVKYYINGEFVAQTNFGQYVGNTWGLGLGYSPSYTGAVQADLDDLRIWERALTPAEIKQHMHYELAGTELNLAVYYDFEHTVGNTSTITSKGIFQQTITLNGGVLAPSTSPIANITTEYQSLVKGKWSKNNIINVVGLGVLDNITNYNSNVVIGKKNDTTTDVVPGSSIALSYLKGGWHIDPFNFTTANLQVDLSQVFTNSATFDATVDHYELIKGDPTGTYEVIATGVSVAGIVNFNNVPLSLDNYYLGYVLTSVLGNDTFNPINNLVSLYPNPTDGKVTILLNDEVENSFYVEVFDAVGRKVFEVKKQAVGSNQKIELDLSGITGEQLFVIRVHIGEKTETFKLLKKG